MMYLKLFLQVIVLPPTSLVILAIAGASLRRRLIGWLMIAAALGLYVVLSLPAVGYGLQAALPRAPAISASDLARAQAIVLLSGGIHPNAPEYDGRDVVNGTTLLRARYAGWLQRRSGLPILVVGGQVLPDTEPEAEVAARVLREEWGVPVHWIVGKGTDTIESAKAAAETLMPEQVSRIALVTSDIHMTRAAIAFRNAGFTVLPAPTGSRSERSYGIRYFLPSAGGMSVSSYAIREWLGRLWTWALG